MNKSTTRISRRIAFVLRHHPEAVGIVLDEHGWARVDELVAALGASHGLTHDLLEQIVATDEKQRYAFNEDHSLIRANQGHSIPVDVELEELEPPAILFHGTAERFVASISEEGLLPRRRLYVHLSPDVKTALKVGARHGKPAVFRVDCQSMRRDGHRFWMSKNHVWLTERVPPQYLSIVDTYAPSTEGTAPATGTTPDERARRIRHHFTGAVQSRGFRYACVKAAGKTHVTGWVENQADVTVVAETQGDPRQQDEFLRGLSMAMPGLGSAWEDLQCEIPLVDGEDSFGARS